MPVFDPNDAPSGYYAVEHPSGTCPGCALFNTTRRRCICSEANCTRGERADWHNAQFRVKEPESNTFHSPQLDGFDDKTLAKTIVMLIQEARHRHLLTHTKLGSIMDIITPMKAIAEAPPVAKL